MCLHCCRSVPEPLPCLMDCGGLREAGLSHHCPGSIDVELLEGVEPEEPESIQVMRPLMRMPGSMGNLQGAVMSEPMPAGSSASQGVKQEATGAGALEDRAGGDEGGFGTFTEGTVLAKQPGVSAGRKAGRAQQGKVGKAAGARRGVRASQSVPSFRTMQGSQGMRPLISPSPSVPDAARDTGLDCYQLMSGGCAHRA